MHPDLKGKGKSQISWIPAQSSRHFVAGGLGGMCGAIVTAPFDVVKTRLQSDMFKVAPTSASRSSNLLYHFVETGHILRDIAKSEGIPALFKGLGPTLVGVIPARSINFFTYGNGKQIIATQLNDGRENAAVHLGAAVIAGVITGTCTNPIWVVKTRMQLSASQSRPFGSAWGCITHIFSNEGIRGFYKGLSASYLGVSEGVIQWTLYEQFKSLARRAEGGPLEWAGMLGAAGSAKMIASLITYPHEVLRTRLRQPVVNGIPKYTGLYQTLRLVIAEEGTRALYGGLSAHLLRVIPNAAVMYSIYEAALRWGK
ncbi:mitochondrial carrier [Serendipita vermifera]|nr:mitochondrial carrier [Serendipita vermifera]